MLYQNKSGVRLATHPLFLRVRTGAAHLGLFYSGNGGDVVIDRSICGIVVIVILPILWYTVKVLVKCRQNVANKLFTPYIPTFATN